MRLTLLAAEKYHNTYRCSIAPNDKYDRLLLTKTPVTELTQGTKNAQALPLLIRRCRKCVGGQMRITAVRQSGAEKIQTFECQTCDARLEMSSAGYIGLQFWAWLLFSGFVIWLFLIDESYASTTTHVVVLGFVAFGGIWCLGDTVKLYQHPLIENKGTAADPRWSGETHPSFIAKLLNLGFFKTPLIFILGAAAFLSLAALAGYIKDYVL